MKKGTLITITGLLAIGLLFSVNFAQAQTIGRQAPGSLDPTFGTGGTVTTTFGGVSVSPLTAIEQSNGNIAVVTGLGNGVPNEEDFALVRYMSSGTLIGVTRAAFFTDGINSPSALAVQSNGDILVVGTASTAIDQPQDIAIARFTPSGQLDTTFGSAGLVTTQIPANRLYTTGLPSVSAVIAQPNGQILVGGFVGSCCKHSPGATVLVRYNSDGSLDTTFGTAGIVMVPSAVTDPAALAELSNGSYLAVGDDASGDIGLVVEFSSTGVLQSTVMPGTVVAATQSGSGTVLFQPNGDYVVAETVSAGRNKSDAEVFRFLETGVLDSSFSSPKFTFGGNSQTEPQAIALQSNGQIVVGGITNAHGTAVTGGLARLDSNGELETTFASGGLVSQEVVSGLLIQTDGKIVAIGNNGNLALARYFAN